MTSYSINEINSDQLDELQHRHRQLIAELEAERARKLAGLDATTDPELRLVASTYASAYLHTIARTLAIFEGPEVARQYVREHADGKHLTSHEDAA